MMSSQLPILIRAFVAFFHPMLMLIALALTGYGLYLGMKVMRTRHASATLRKEMIRGRYNQRHFHIGSMLLMLWVVGSVIGMAVTFVLYNQLFFSPHLIGGLSVMCLGAAAAALAPALQQGKKWARMAHISLAILILGLSISQTVTGFAIAKEMLGEMFLAS